MNIKRNIESFFYRTFRGSRTFTFQGRSCKYFYHRHNTTWRNARAVELPIIWEIVRNHRGKRILEVGNVLSHYFPVSHDVLDKYEKGEGVINKDVVDFKPSTKYDLIVSISTLEHVGWDERPRDPMKVLRAVESLVDCLAPSGKLAVTFPLAYNPELDKLLKDGKLQFTGQRYLKRVSRDNRWKEVEWEDVRDARYGYPYPRANALVIGTIDKQSVE
jgi:SAM-dependent methyltransferase